MSVTLHDVARAAGVSIKTVSEVVNRSTRVAPHTRARVEAAVAELGYQPNLSARRLRSGRTGVVGLAIPELTMSGHFSELAASVVEAAERLDLVVLIEQTGGLRANELAALSSARRSMTDGLLLNALELDPTDVAGLPRATPTVLLGERRLGDRFDHVTFRNADAAHAATTHLVRRGRRRILLLSGWRSTSASAAARLVGFSRALADSGVDPDPSLVVEVDRWDHETGLLATRDALARGVRFDAVLGMNDALALGAIRALHDAGLAIPGDVAVVGFDNIIESRHSHPRLTTIDPRRDTIATHAIDLLLARLADKDDAAPAQYVEHDFELIARESTDLPTVT
jgi:DNA-binding LacI/PurR family transcriptional regulator